MAYHGYARSPLGPDVLGGLDSAGPQVECRTDDALPDRNLGWRVPSLSASSGLVNRPGEALGQYDPAVGFSVMEVLPSARGARQVSGISRKSLPGVHPGT